MSRTYACKKCNKSGEHLDNLYKCVINVVTRHQQKDIKILACRSNRVLSLNDISLNIFVYLLSSGPPLSAVLRVYEFLWVVNFSDYKVLWIWKVLQTYEITWLHWLIYCSPVKQSKENLFDNKGEILILFWQIKNALHSRASKLFASKAKMIWNHHNGEETSG